jgi:hypothetical protein
MEKENPGGGRPGFSSRAIGMGDFDRPRHQTASIDHRPG